MRDRTTTIEARVAAVGRRARSPAAQKTCSWAVVSFFVIWPIEVGGHYAMYGADGIGHAVRAAALGTALACVGKMPAYWLHEHAWAWLAARRGRPRPARPRAAEVCHAGVAAD